MENPTKDDISRILELAIEILGAVRDLKERRNEFEGEPMLDFSEVCQLLHQSERQVRRYREQGRLIGFNIGRRRMYFASEVNAFIKTMHKQGRLSKTIKTF